MEDRRVAQRALVRKPEGKRSLGRSRPRWKDNIKTSSGNGIGGTGWIGLAQDRDRCRAHLRMR
jgi:hypothetical protein